MLQKIRIANYPDISESLLYELIREIYHSSAFMSKDFEEKFPTFQTFQTFLKQIEDAPGAFLIVAFCDDQPAGHLVIEPKQASRLKHAAWLNMGITEKFRGKGIGKMLVDAAFDKITTEKIIEIIYLMVREDNFAAIKLYQKKGFEIVASLEKDTKIGRAYFTGVLMRKFINVNPSQI